MVEPRISLLEAARLVGCAPAALDRQIKSGRVRSGEGGTVLLSEVLEDRIKHLDEIIGSALAKDLTADPQSRERRYQLYRHFDKRWRLLYVGQSLSAIGRLIDHRQSSPWFDDIATVTIENFGSQAELNEAEREAIRNEYPLHNKMHNLRPLLPSMRWTDEISRGFRQRANDVVSSAFASGLVADNDETSNT